VGVDPTGHVKLGPSNDYPVGPTIYYMKILIRVCLVGWTPGSVPLGIGHGSHHHEVFVLNVGQPLFEPPKIVSAVFLVDLIGHRISGIDAVVPYTPLEAAARLLTQDPEELDLLDEVLNILVHVRETADGPAGQMGRGRGQVPILFGGGQGIGHGRCPNVRSRSRMPGYILNPFSLIVNNGA